MSCYIDNPLPSLLKEKLFAYLSRYCDKPYCLVCHSCFLLPLGMTPSQVRSLVCMPTPGNVEIRALLDEGMETENRSWKQNKGELDHLVIRLSAVFYLKLQSSDAAHLLLGRILGEQFEHLVTFLGYVRMCGLWIDSHPELSYEADKRAQDSLPSLLHDEPTLTEFFRAYIEVVKAEMVEINASLNVRDVSTTVQHFSRE